MMARINRMTETAMRRMQVTSGKDLEAARAAPIGPRGSLVRAVIYVAFRLLHPYYTAQSILYWGREELRLLRQLGPLGYAEHVVQLRLKPLWHNFFKAKN